MLSSKNYIIFIFLCFSCSVIYAQLNATPIGNAISQGNNCYIITPDLLNQSGAVWYDNAIDFDNDFTINYQNSFGNKDGNGADGMALVFKRNPAPQIGSLGGGLGYQGISPSLVVEFDTYLNNTAQEGLLADPFFDHIAIMRNGNPFHNSADNLAGPVQASNASGNIEDGNTHEIKIEWSASTTTLNVYFDCVLRLSLNQDVKNTIFSGDDSVFFGFVGSTGGLSNLHQVCFNSISFIDNLQLQDETICENDNIQVDATIPSGATYSWLPINDVSNPNIANPTFSPNSTTTYTVTIGDVCGDTTVDDFILTVLPNQTPTFNAVLPICEGESPTALPTSSLEGITGTWSPTLNNTQTTTYTFTPNAGECANNTDLTITVIPNSIPEFDVVNPICPGEFLQELPLVSNNGITGTWSPALDNQNTTSYTFTPDTGQGCVASSSLIIEVLQPTIPSFSLPDFICRGDTDFVLPNVSNEGITGNWSEPVNNQITTEYIFTPNPNQCASVIEIEIEVLPVNELELSIELISEPFSDNQIVVAVATGGDGMYEYQLDNGVWTTQNTFSNIRGCDERVIRARQINNCSIDAIEIFRVLDYPKFFTPNGDGFNDLWNIECLINQTNAQIYIFDRFGKLLKTISPRGTGWNGTYNGAPMPTSDYWFRVDYLGNDGSSRTFTSHFTLKR